MPPSADSNSPRFCCRASVNAPRSWPNSSLSSSVSGSAEHVMFMNGLLARSLLKCSTFAARSLPVPLSPVSSTVDAGLVATFASSERSMPIAADSPDDAIDAVGSRLRRAQTAHFAPQLRGLQRTRHQKRHVVQIERLVGEVERTFLHRFDRGLDAGVGGEEDDEGVGVELLDALEHGHAVHVGQLVIEEHEIDAVARALERLLAGAGLLDVIPFGAHPLGQRPANQLLVVDHQNPCARHRHYLTSPMRIISRYWGIFPYCSDAPCARQPAETAQKPGYSREGQVARVSGLQMARQRRGDGTLGGAPGRRVTDRQHGTWRRAYDALGDAAQQAVRQSAAAVCAHHDEIGPSIRGLARDDRRHAADEHSCGDRDRSRMRRGHHLIEPPLRIGDEALAESRKLDGQGFCIRRSQCEIADDVEEVNGRALLRCEVERIVDGDAPLPR